MRLILSCALCALLPLQALHAAETTVHGIVTDSVTGLTVDGASLSLRISRGFIPCIDPVSPTVTSAADGRFAVATTYEHSPCLSAGASGYLSQQIDLPVLGSGGGSIEQDVALVPYPRVEVLVRDLQSGLPIEGAAILGAVSAADGSVVLDSLEPGDYHVCADATVQGYAIACLGEPVAWHASAGTAVTLSAGEVYQYTLDLQAGGGIDIALRDPGSAPAPSTYPIRLQLWSLQGEALAERYVSASEGHYSLHGLPPGPVHVVAEPSSEVYFIRVAHPAAQCMPACDFAAAEPLDVIAGELVQATIEVQPQAVLQGRVSDATTGSALSGVRVVAYEDVVFFKREVGEARTGPDGRFEVSWLRGDALYLLGAIARDGYGSLSWPDLPCYERECTEGDEVPAALRETVTGLDFALVRGHGISGTVISSIHDAPIAGAWVNLWEGGFTVWSGTTDRDGRYSSAAMPASNYKVNAGHAGACAAYPAAACGDFGGPGPDAAEIAHGVADSAGIDVLLAAPATTVFLSGFETP